MNDNDSAMKPVWPSPAMDPGFERLVTERSESLFAEDLRANKPGLREALAGSRVVVVGAAGSIGSAVVRTLLEFEPASLCLIDLSENNLVELVRDLRSSLGYIEGDFRALPLDCGSPEFSAFLARESSGYDFVLNLSALKHVRSEKDPYSLMRMIQVNILNTRMLLRTAPRDGGRFFCVSTDKATRPVNMMGASKRIMELFLLWERTRASVSTARFANVAFSDGSLLHGFDARIRKRQPLAAPNDVRRYFINSRESGELCLMACLLGDDRELLFPKLDAGLHLITFSEIAERYLRSLGYRARPCPTEDEARATVEESAARGEWPCFFFESDTTGEKDYEEFYTEADQPDLERFHDLGVLRLQPESGPDRCAAFEQGIMELRRANAWTKEDLVRLFHEILPDFAHAERGKYLDGRM
jgi:FlaA1/EpsC-like NDP-sugar epimerase